MNDGVIEGGGVYRIMPHSLALFLCLKKVLGWMLKKYRGSHLPLLLFSWFAQNIAEVQMVLKFDVPVARCDAINVNFNGCIVGMHRSIIPK